MKKNEIRASKWAGRSGAEIAAEEGLHPSGVLRYARKHGIALKDGRVGPVGKRWRTAWFPKPEDYEATRDTWNGRSARSIAEEVGISSSRVRMIAREIGAKLLVVRRHRSPEEIADIVRRWPGRKAKEIALAEGLCADNVRVTAQNYGIQLAGNRGTWADRRERRQKEWPGKSAREIACDENLTLPAVLYYCRRHNIKTVEK